MTSIERVEGRPAVARTAVRGERQGGAAFAAALAAEAGRNAAPAAPAAAAALGPMLALQESAAAPVRDREARRRGQGLLAALAALQHGLLSGDGGGALQRLADLAVSVPEPEDKRLGAVLAAIVLRARVELARHGL